MVLLWARNARVVISLASVAQTALQQVRRQRTPWGSHSWSQLILHGSQSPEILGVICTAKATGFQILSQKRELEGRTIGFSCFKNREGAQHTWQDGGWIQLGATCCVIFSEALLTLLLVLLGPDGQAFSAQPQDADASPFAAECHAATIGCD